MLYRVFKIKRYKFLFRKFRIIERNCSDKNYKIQKDLFTDFINLILGSKVRLRSHRFLKNGTPYF